MRLFSNTGNIRVYCRLRPFLPGQKEKQSIVEHVGENDLVVANPAKQGKEALRTFKFNKVFGPTSTQGLFLYNLHFIIRFRMHELLLHRNIYAC